jgi:hypothetical protein
MEEEVGNDVDVSGALLYCLPVCVFRPCSVPPTS